MSEPLDPHGVGFSAAQSANEKGMLPRRLHQNSLLPFMIVKDKQHRRIWVYRQFNRSLRCRHRLACCRVKLIQAGKILKIRGSKMQLKIHMRRQLRGGA